MSADVTVPTAAAQAPSLVWLDPATLMSHPANVRDELGDVSELASSVAVAGVIEPLVVIPHGDGGVRILAGHRRAAAAVVAGLEAVPCLVRPDLAGADDEQLAAALAENIQRQGLSPQEEAHAYAQLSAFPGWSTGRIAQATGRDELAVRRSIEATQLAEELQPAAIAGQLSLEDAARVASFADDPDTYATLLQLTGNGGLRHALVRAEREREVARHAAEVRERLEAEGVRIVERPRHRDVALNLTSLEDADGAALDPDEHAAGCAGHAAYIDDYDGEAVAVCLDPGRFGHRTPQWYRHETQEQAAAREAAEEAARARRVALEEAATLRREFIRSLATAKGKVPVGTLRLAVELLVDGTVGLPDPCDLAFYLGYDAEAADAETVVAELVRKAPDRRLPAVVLALVAPGAEDNLEASDTSWGYSPALALRWLGFLADAGHELTEAETRLVDEARRSLDGDSDHEGGDG